MHVSCVYETVCSVCIFLQICLLIGSESIYLNPKADGCTDYHTICELRVILNLNRSHLLSLSVCRRTACALTSPRSEMKLSGERYLSCSCLLTTARWTERGSGGLPWSGICWIPVCPLCSQTGSGENRNTKEHDVNTESKQNLNISHSVLCFCLYALMECQQWHQGSKEWGTKSTIWHISSDNTHLYSFGNVLTLFQ